MHQKRRVCDLREGDAFAVGAGIVPAHEHALRLEPEQARVQAVRRGRAAHRADVDRPVHHSGDGLGGGHHLRRHVHAGEPVREVLDQQWHRLVSRADRVAEGDRAPLARAERSRGAPELVGRVEQRRAPLEQEAPRGRELERVGRAMQELDPELLLEQAHLAAQRRLGDVQELGRAGEIALAGNSQEVAQPAQLGHRALACVHAGRIFTQTGSVFHKSRRRRFTGRHEHNHRHSPLHHPLAPPPACRPGRDVHRAHDGRRGRRLARCPRPPDLARDTGASRSRAAMDRRRVRPLFACLLLPAGAFGTATAARASSRSGS